MRYKKTITLLIIISILLVAQPIFAQGLFSDIPCFKTGSAFEDCKLCDFLYLLLKLANWGLGIMGALALLSFVIGGVMWLISAGNTNLISKGKSILTGTITGIIIILSAYLIINLAISAFTGQWGKFYTKQGLKDWYNVCEIKTEKPF